MFLLVFLRGDGEPVASSYAGFIFILQVDNKTLRFEGNLLFD